MFGLFLGRGWFWAAIAFLLALHCAIDLRLMPDSRDYIEMASHLAAGKGFVTHTLDASTRVIPDVRLHHPPGYGAFLGALQWLGLPVLAALRLLTVLCFTGTAILVWFLIPRLAPAAHAPAAMALYLALSLLFEPWSYAMSEGPFQLLTAATLLWLVRHPRPEPGTWALAGALAGLATLCRWIGVSLPLAAALWLWPRRKRKDAWFAVIALGAGYTLVVGPWLARNALLTGRMMGKVSEPSHIPVWLNIVAFSRTLLLDLLPVLVLLLVACAIGRRVTLSRPERFLLLWAGAYSFILLFMASISFIDPISTRLTLPLYLALVPFCGTHALRRLGPVRFRPAMVCLAAGLLILTGVFQVVNARRRAAAAPISATGPLSEWIADHTPPGSLIVNPAAAPVYFPAAGERSNFVQFFRIGGMDPAQPRAFLDRFPGRFPALFLVLPAEGPAPGAWESAWQLTAAGEVNHPYEGQSRRWLIFQIQPRARPSSFQGIR